MTSAASVEYIRKLRENPAFGALGFNLDELREGMATRREPTIDGAQCMAVDVDGLPAEWVVADGADADVRVLYLHGGGYVSGSGAFYLALAAHLSAAAQCAVLLVDYRLAPEHPFPAGLDDCIRAYEWIRGNSPVRPAPATATFIAGDSAGGGLTLAALLALRDRHLPLPHGGIALSPYADLTLTGASIESEAELDPIMHPKCLPDFVRLYVDDAQVRNPLASPVFGDYAGIPPLLIQVGEHEIIRDDSIAVAQQARSAGVSVTLEMYAGMFHVFQSHEPLLPEAVDAFASMARFLRSCMNP